MTSNSSNIENLLTRGVEKIFPNYESVKNQLSQKSIRVYYGIDPTAPTLHIGHAIGLRKLAEFQKLGHQIILLIGDFTAMIGDPTDKTATRKQLSKEQVLENCKNYKKLAEKIISFNGDNPAEFKFNSEWLAKLTLNDLLELGSMFTVQNMLDRDMFKQRLKEEKPIYLHEFFYPLMQGYDSVALNVDGEIGGNDQTFNMLAGRDLCKQIKGGDKFVLTFKLLTDQSGKKMGKSEGNMITLEDSPNEMFGKIMSWTDGMIMPGFELCTEINMNEIKSMEEKISKSEINPRDAKILLAQSIVKLHYDSEQAENATKYFIETFSNKQTPDTMPEVKTVHTDIIDILVEQGLCTSKTDARRAIEQGGVRVNEQTISLEQTKLTPQPTGIIIQKGKRHFIKVFIV